MEEHVGLGPPAIELYRQLKLQGALEGITDRCGIPVQPQMYATRP
jgi:hypothetical protein